MNWTYNHLVHIETELNWELQFSFNTALLGHCQVCCVGCRGPKTPLTQLWQTQMVCLQKILFRLGSFDWKMQTELSSSDQTWLGKRICGTSASRPWSRPYPWPPGSCPGGSAIREAPSPWPGLEGCPLEWKLRYRQIHIRLKYNLFCQAFFGHFPGFGG